MSGIDAAISAPVRAGVLTPICGTDNGRHIAEKITGVPAKVSGVSPLDEAIHIQLDQVIRWNRPAMAQSYDVYIGPNAGALVKVSSAQAARSYVPTLELDSTYYIRIDSKNSFGGGSTTTGDVTSFTTWSEDDILTDGDGVPVTDGNGEYIETPSA